ncbi:C39 family peptidase [Saccharopolyspora hattusasensis]|uniref:C39 family peptidase n=1 Tax=Saccharopolyspora hattusasensis TaxID=1128679 RepID=UPI003D95D1B4
MPKHHEADGHAPKAAVRALVHRSRSGKAVSAVLAGGAIVAIGYPLVAGAVAAPAPVPPPAGTRAADIRAVEHASPAPAPAPAPAATPTPAPAEMAAPTAPATPAAPAAAPVPETQSAPETHPQAVTKTLTVDYQAQQTGYWCGPAAARIALSSKKTENLPDQAALATELGTTKNGTDHIRQIVDGLNKQLAGTGTDYVTKDWGGRPLTPEMTEELWSDTVRNVDNGKAMVANIVAPPGNQPAGYPKSQTIYHYVVITGYNAENNTVHISDSARFSGNEQYWLSLDQLASLIQPRGYAA